MGLRVGVPMEARMRELTPVARVTSDPGAVLHRSQLGFRQPTLPNSGILPKTESHQVISVAMDGAGRNLVA